MSEAWTEQQIRAAARRLYSHGSADSIVNALLAELRATPAVPQPAAVPQHRYDPEPVSTSADAPCRFCRQGSRAMVHAEPLPAIYRNNAFFDDSAPTQPATTPADVCLNCGKTMADHGAMANCYPTARYQQRDSQPPEVS